MPNATLSLQRMRELPGDWVLYEGREVERGDFNCPTWEEIQELPRFASLAKVWAGWRALPPGKKKFTVWLHKASIERKALKIKVLRGAHENEGRLQEIMLERGCSRTWALELYRRETLGVKVNPPGRLAKPEDERVSQLMAEKGCGRAWAVELLRREQRGEEPKKAGAKRVYDRARLAEIMIEHGCGRVKAYQLLKEELIAAAAAAAAVNVTGASSGPQQSSSASPGADPAPAGPATP